jgi:hypothetical protein
MPERAHSRTCCSPEAGEPATAPLLLEPRSDVVVAPHAFSAAWSSELPFALCDVGRDGHTRRSAGPSR